MITQREDCAQDLLRIPMDPHQWFSSPSTLCPFFAAILPSGAKERRTETPAITTNSGVTDIGYLPSPQFTMFYRTCGVEVDCHNANGTYLYHFDNFVQGGANTVIHVVVQALDDLSKILAAQGHKLPQRLCLQFDNCGENKNKTLFSFLSHLVASLKFLEIFVSLCVQPERSHFNFFCFEVNFLIVGHTHCSLDQFFSVLSRAIKAAEFIPSPAALMELYATAHKGASAHLRPIVNKQIHAVFDWVQMYAPFINGEFAFHFYLFLLSYCTFFVLLP